MRITSKGQVTIPQDIRERAGFMPNTEVDFVWDGELVYLVKSSERGRRPTRGQRAVAASAAPRRELHDVHRRAHGADEGRGLTAGSWWTRMC